MALRRTEMDRIACVESKPDPADSSSAVELRHLRALVALAEERHFGHAARRLHVTQPTLSRTIASLEAVVGTQLVDRSPGRVDLNPAGRRLLPIARRMLRDTASLPRVARTRDRSLRIGLMASAGWRELTAAFTPDGRIGGHPVELVPITLAEGFDPIRHGDVDAGIYHLPLIVDPALEVRVIGESNPIAAVPAGGRLAQAGRCTVPDIGASLLIVPRHHPEWGMNFEALLRAHGVAPPDVLIVASYEEAVARVGHGEGICVAPHAADLPSWPEVELVPLIGFETVRTGLVWSPEAPSDAIERLAAALAV